MKTLAQIVEEKNQAKARKVEQDRLVEGVTKEARSNTVSSTSAVINALTSLQNHWEELSANQQKEVLGVLQKVGQDIGEKIKPAELEVSFNGLQKLSVETLEISGLRELFSSTADSMRSLSEEIKDWKAPAINIPEIKVPEPKTPVIPPINIPPINVPQPKVTVSVPAPIIDFDRLKEEYPERISIKRDNFGGIQSITETYRTGKVISKKVDGDWIIDDKRK